MSVSVVLPRMMEIGAGALRKLPDIVSALQGANALIVTDKMMVKLGYIAQIKTLLAAAGIDSGVFDGTEPEPTAASIEAGMAYVNGAAWDVIIAVGGGSPIDSAKALSILGRHGGNIRDYKFPHQADAPGIPLIAIPTTAGTGSEVTRFTIITDEKKQRKNALRRRRICAGSRHRRCRPDPEPARPHHGRHRD
ncbi:Alcohol dehydrogenase 2 [Pluralibacter gergoviae]|nr:Alcohol dehydrogenase 2 [Pluralibacter gergoviae]